MDYVHSRTMNHLKRQRSRNAKRIARISAHQSDAPRRVCDFSHLHEYETCAQRPAKIRIAGEGSSSQSGARRMPPKYDTRFHVLKQFWNRLAGPSKQWISSWRAYKNKMRLLIASGRSRLFSSYAGSTSVGHTS